MTWDETWDEMRWQYHAENIRHPWSCNCWYSEDILVMVCFTVLLSSYCLSVSPKWSSARWLCSDTENDNKVITILTYKIYFILSRFRMQLKWFRSDTDHSSRLTLLRKSVQPSGTPRGSKSLWFIFGCCLWRYDWWQYFYEIQKYASLKNRDVTIPKTQGVIIPRY